MTWPEPAWYLGGLLVILTLGFLLPLRVEGRQDHIVVTISNGVAGATLGARGLVILLAATVAAMSVRAALPLVAPARRRPSGTETRRAVGWIGVSAIACAAGAIAGILVYAGIFGRQFPVQLDDTPSTLIAAIVAMVAWGMTMGVRIASQKLILGTVMTRGIDPLDSPLIPYLLPLVGGFPLITASVAMYRPDDPLMSLGIVTWCFPLYAASAFDVHRRDQARELRRDAFARQRLVAIGEVSARIVHQSRHQVGLMGWSIHRLRSMTTRPGGVDVRIMRAELDALAEAKDRLSETLAAELLHESDRSSGGAPPVDAGRRGPDGVPGADAVPGAPTTVAEVIADVAELLRAEADREGVLLRTVSSGPDGGEAAALQLHDVVFNLVDNAIDAAGSEVVVRIDRAEGAGPSGTPTVTLVVEDDGPGLDDHEGRRAFEPFFTTKADGTGMGLAIADALVGDLGGELRYERADGRTRFVIALPGAVVERAG